MGWQRMIGVALGVCLMLSAPGCAPKHTIEIAGSTSVQPLAEVLAQEYRIIHPGVQVNVQGGGSSVGITAARNGTAAIGTSSRDLKPEEQPGLQAIPIAIDGIAVIVNAANPVNSLTMEQIRKIYTGEVDNWEEVGGHAGPITVITREVGSGTRDAFESTVMRKQKILRRAIVLNATGGIRQAVAGDKRAIGYISLGLVTPEVKALAVDGVLPTRETILAKKYPIARPFLFVVKGEPQGEVKDFINFVLGDGQAIVEREGFIRVK